MFTACSLARPMSGLFLVVADVQALLTFSVFGSSAIFQARFDFVHLSGPFLARPLF